MRTHTNDTELTLKASKLVCLGPLPVETKVESSLAIPRPNLRLGSMLLDRYTLQMFMHHNNKRP